MRIVFMGSADFGIPALKCICEHHVVTGVVSTPSRPKGRGLKMQPSPLMSFALEQGIGPVLTPQSMADPGLVAALRAMEADCFVVVAFRLLPKNIFSIPSLGTVNIHASLLPSYRGPAPIQRAIEAGETASGVTVFRIDEGIDTGAILQQVPVTIAQFETTPELYERLSVLGSAALVEALDNLECGTAVARLQQGSPASRAPKLQKHEALIDWKQPAEKIFNKLRAFKPFPGVHTFADGKRLGIEWGLPLPSSWTVPIGSVAQVAKDHFDIQTGSGILRILEVKPEGRRKMSVRDYLAGSHLREGYVFHE